MADNVIKVSVTSTKSQRVSVSSSQQATNITASPDTGRFWSQTSKNWAVSENIVDGEDYSSKYYANKSKGYAQNAESFEAAARETYNSFVSDANGYVNELTELKDAGVEEINEAVASGKDEINSTKTTIINDIEFVADGEKKEIEDLIDSGKEELKESIGDVKVLTTLEIGDIGIAPLGIDETKGKRRYLNGQLIIQEQYVQFTNKVKSAIELYPSLACTESEWQTTATMTVGGQVGKFVVDDEAGTIRLPKIIMPIQGLTDLSKLAEIVEAGLPNITGYIGTTTGTNSAKKGIMNASACGGAFSGNTQNKKGFGDASDSLTSLIGLSFDASRSSSVYGKSKTVQQEQIQYPYFIQVATGAETEDNIINEIELNNPFSLLDYKYSEYELNNLSWLRSNGQYNSKAIYPAVYDLLLKIYNGTETKAGVSVKLSTEDYTDYDFVLNTAEETFRLPIKVKQTPMGGTAPIIWGDKNTNTAGTNIGFTGYTYAGNAMAQIWTGTDDDNNGTVITSGSVNYIEADLSKATNDNLYLYFYVGETVQNANLINAGRIEEKLLNYTTHNMVDGQWVSINAELSTTIKVGTYVLDLSNILPNDGYDYEVMLSSWSGKSSTSGGFEAWAKSSIITTDVIIAKVSTSGRTSVCCINLPVGKDRTITKKVTETISDAFHYLTAVGYRRLGTNQ